ncbi:putative reverse transcriptase domain-containing protein [Tanacetum coccineum]
MLAQVSNQGNVGNQNDNVVNEKLSGECMECDSNGTGQKVKYTAGSFVSKALTCHEIQKLESELWNHAMVGAGHAAYTDRFHELARTIKILRERKCGEPSKDRNGREDNKRTRTVNAFATTVNPVGRENTVLFPLPPYLLYSLERRLSFKYEIEIASGQLVEIDKVIKGCKLEIEGHIFDIDLIPFGHGSFDVIIGMDWLSNFKAKIICHEKVVRIPLPDGKFRIKLTPVATPVAKSPYRLAPFELEELSGQLKELQDKVSNPLGEHVPRLNEQNILRGCGFCEEVWILLSDLTFAFPRELWTSLGVPSNFDDGNTTSP